MDLEHFIDQLISERGINSEDPEIRAQVREDLIERVEDRVQAMILASLPEDQLEAFDQKLDSGKEEDIQVYLREVIPDFDEKLAAELIAFRAAYVS